ncbi:hypothetical protein DFH08DRAFT_811104 [Mycena albidolilacea]|uniref:Uncharacterized protein n=1 Tax=Mycena albidolilacea TaxID=1033008 RepID=A0AAD6ZW90_9AGAR|nr:hypothetical protein DFH08DRAFT_811104 [Mycena albidolilacea]
MIVSHWEVGGSFCGGTQWQAACSGTSLLASMHYHGAEIKLLEPQLDPAHSPFFSIEEAPSWITSHGYQLFLTHDDSETATSWDLDDASAKQLKAYHSCMVSEYYQDHPFFSLENTKAWISLIPFQPEFHSSQLSGTFLVSLKGQQSCLNVSVLSSCSMSMTRDGASDNDGLPEDPIVPDTGPNSSATSAASLPTHFIPFQRPSSPVLAAQPKSKKSKGKGKARAADAAEARPTKKGLRN